MGDWVTGALVNIVGSVTINFGTNLLKLGHDQVWIHSYFSYFFNQRTLASLLSNRKKVSESNSDEGNAQLTPKSIMHFQTWRIGILLFAVGNCLNFMSFAYAAQSLLAALGSIQFVSNIAFSNVVFNRTVSLKVMVATSFIVFGNIFLVSFGNHQSPVYTQEQLVEKYSNSVFHLYCLSLVFVVVSNHFIYRRGESMLSISGKERGTHWPTLLPFSYAAVSGAVGSWSVLFAKSLSNMLRLTVSSGYHLHNWFTYSVLLLFLSTAGFWMTRLNEGLSLFDAILIVPMFQIVWTFFSMCTGFVYFQEYQVFDTLRLTMFLLGIVFVFIGISLLTPDDSKADTKDSSKTSQGLPTDMNRHGKMRAEGEVDAMKSFVTSVKAKAKCMLVKAKAACSSLSIGFTDSSSISASPVLTMPEVTSRKTSFRGTIIDRSKFIPFRTADWDDDDDL